MPEEARLVLGPQMPRYHAWRRVILDAQMLATRRPVDQDPWDGLRRVARLTMGREAADGLRILERLFHAMPPSSIAETHAIAAGATLATAEAPIFRRAIRILSDLHDHDLAVATGLLPPRFAPLPPRPVCRDHLPLPARLAAAFADQPPRARDSAACCWSVAVKTGLFQRTADPTPAQFLDSWKDLVLTDPAAHGLSQTVGAWQRRLRQLTDVLVNAGAPDPRVETVDGAWAALLAAVRETGRRATVLSSIAAPAKAEGLRPRDLTPAWIADRIAPLSGDRLRSFRSACLLVDSVRGDGGVPTNMLPAEPTGIVRARQRPRSRDEVRRAPSVDPVRQAWIELFAALRRAGVSADDLNPVSAIRSEAIAHGLTPGEVDLVAVEGWRGKCGTRRADKLARGAKLLDRLRHHPALADHLPTSPIGDVKDRRRSAPELEADIGDELDSLLQAQGASDPSRRAASIAVRALADALATCSDGGEAASLGRLLAADTTGLDWGRHASQAPTHQEVLRRLRAFRDLPWTPAWRTLQAAIVAAGVQMRDNPVPALLRRAGDREPMELDLVWARSVDRSLRRDGRADLARTFGRDLERLDALHARADWRSPVFCRRASERSGKRRRRRRSRPSGLDRLQRLRPGRRWRRRCGPSAANRTFCP